MPTIKEAVHTAIDQDIFLQEGIERDILNKRAVARWLIKARGIEGSFETVYDAVEDYEPEAQEAERTPWTALEDMRIQITKDVHALVLEQGARSRESLGKLFNAGSDPDQVTYRVIPSRGRILVVVDAADRDEVFETLGAEVITKPGLDLFQLAIQPRDGGHPGTLPISLIVLALTSRGIEVPYVASGETEQFILVSKEDEAQAMEVITELLVDPAA